MIRLACISSIPFLLRESEMVWRGQFGERNGSHGGWISKPGYDVRTAAPGNFMLDTDSQVFQIVARGTTIVLVISSQDIPARTETVSVNLPSPFATFSRLFVSATFTNYSSSDGLTYTLKFTDPTERLLYWRVSNGVLTFYFQHPLIRGLAANTVTFVANWTIYRCQF